MSRRRRRCHYCGWAPAKVRHPGEPPTCYGCRDLPKAEQQGEQQLELELERYYSGEQSSRS